MRRSIRRRRKQPIEKLPWGARPTNQGFSRLEHDDEIETRTEQVLYYKQSTIQYPYLLHGKHIDCPRPIRVSVGWLDGRSAGRPVSLPACHRLAKPTGRQVSHSTKQPAKSIRKSDICSTRVGRVFFPMRQLCSPEQTSCNSSQHTNIRSKAGFAVNVSLKITPLDFFRNS